MRLSNEEFELLKKNTMQIEKYLTSMMPSIDESIKVEFGDMVVKRGPYGMPVHEIEFELIVGKERLVGWSGGLRYNFTTDKDAITSNSTNVYSRGFGERYMLMLIRDWPIIKYKVHNAITRQQAQRDRIHNFSV